MIERWQQKMIQCLFPYSAARLKIEDGFIAKFPNVPLKLYKYRDFSNDFHRDGLENDEQWFSSPDRFNDPFDTIAYFNVNSFARQRQTIDEIHQEIENIKELEAHGGTWQATEITNPISHGEWRSEIVEPYIDDLPKEYQEPIRAMFKSTLERLNAEMVQQMSSVLRSGFSVLSLSNIATSKLMWSHYASSHTGFCIEFDFGQLPYDNIRKRMCFPVFYRRKRTDISRYFSRPPAQFNNLVGQYLCLMKDADWSYEEEWRIVHAIGPSEANRAHAMPPPSALIVGASISDENLEYAKSFCGKRNIPLKRARLSSNSNHVTVVSS